MEQESKKNGKFVVNVQSFAAGSLKSELGSITSIKREAPEEVQITKSPAASLEKSTYMDDEIQQTFGTQVNQGLES